MARQRVKPHLETRTTGRVHLWLIIPALAWLLFYAAPLFSPTASIQWDAVDVHLNSQQYLAEELRAGRIPFWTPYVFSGFPFLADPQVGSFYPPNWPFLALGAGPKAIQSEIALHGALAAIGAFLLLRLATKDYWAAAFASIAYPFSGFFAGHASHVGMLQAASLLPWLLYFGERFLARPSLVWLGASGTTAGFVLLAGHLQTALYSFAGFTIYLMARSCRSVHDLLRTLAFVTGSVVLGLMISAVMILPAWELSGRSIRALAAYGDSTEGALTFGSLATLVAPSALGALGPTYSGPGDRTQYYFYGGLFLLPLALVACFRARGRMPALMMLVVAVWFMLGPAAGLYRLAAFLPWFDQVRAPIHGWFVASLGLVWLAGAGLRELQISFPARWLGPTLCAVMALDLCLWNSWGNPLTYARQSFDTLYGPGLSLLRDRIVPLVPEGARFDAPNKLTAFGPMNSPLLVRMESTFGYNPLELALYADFRQAAVHNPQLLDALSVAQTVDANTGQVVLRQDRLPKAWFPTEVRRLDDRDGLLAELAELRPQSRALVSRVEATSAQKAFIERIETSTTQWRVHYRAETGGLLALSLPFFPGWRAEVSDKNLAIMPVNHALSGLSVPAGSHELVLRFQSQYFLAGLIVSCVSLLITAILCWKGRAAD